MRIKRIGTLLFSFFILSLLLACERSEISNFRAAEKLTKQYVDGDLSVLTEAESIDQNGLVMVHAYVMEGDQKATISYYKVNTKTKTVTDTME